MKHLSRQCYSTSLKQNNKYSANTRNNKLPPRDVFFHFWIYTYGVIITVAYFRCTFFLFLCFIGLTDPVLVSAFNTSIADCIRLVFFCLNEVVSFNYTFHRKIKNKLSQSDKLGIFLGTLGRILSCFNIPDRTQWKGESQFLPFLNVYLRAKNQGDP